MCESTPPCRAGNHSFAKGVSWPSIIGSLRRQPCLFRNCPQSAGNFGREICAIAVRPRIQVDRFPHVCSRDRPRRALVFENQTDWQDSQSVQTQSRLEPEGQDVPIRFSTVRALLHCDSCLRGRSAPFRSVLGHPESHGTLPCYGICRLITRHCFWSSSLTRRRGTTRIILKNSEINGLSASVAFAVMVIRCGISHPMISESTSAFW